MLDVGCGLGYGTNLIAEAGYDVEGIDKSKIAIKVASSRYPYINFVVGEFSRSINKNYDAIVAAEIIEHVSDHELFIKDCLSLIRYKGVLLLTTPNGKYARQKKSSPH